MTIKITFVVQKYLNLMYHHTDITETIFNEDFEKAVLEVFRFQYNNNIVYRNYVDALKVNVSTIRTPESIPFLPIRFFKTHQVVTTHFNPTIIFESSGTTETINSKHYVKDTSLYEKSFTSCFRHFYGEIKDWCILGLLPSYLERENSSLVYMVQKLIEKSNHPYSGFYLYDFEQLAAVIKQVEQEKQPTLLIGVTFALLDFAAAFPTPFQYTTIIETGGMKGRKKELLRKEVHDILHRSFGNNAIHSEYGMTELLSQAYSKGNGIFKPPKWMRVLLRDEDDPLSIKPLDNEKRRGVLNIIDLANIYSCSFIATDDLGILYADGSFEVTGRRDNSDLRGCSLLSL